MKMAGYGSIGLLMTLLCAPLIHGQDLSRYRNFSLGTGLTSVSSQIDQKPADVIVLHEHPALIQQLKWWLPTSYSASSVHSEAAQKMIFSFYNGELYRIAVIYDDSATKGLTADDMIRTLSRTYGAATRPAGQTAEDFGTKNRVLARWEDARYSMNLIECSPLSAFGLVVFAKQANAQADMAASEASKLELQGAPQKEADRLQKEHDDLEATRQKNLENFLP